MKIDPQRGTTPKARPLRIYYMTQAKVAPPTFLMFTNQKNPLHFSYERFLENQIRAKFDFVGTPTPLHPTPAQEAGPTRRHRELKWRFSSGECDSTAVENRLVGLLL